MIIAFDFDGTLVKDEVPGIGPADDEMITLARVLGLLGHEIILWSSRAEPRLTEAVKWCREHGLQFCAVNENSPSNINKYSGDYPIPSRKVYADLYIDDRCITYDRTEVVKKLTEMVLKGEVK